MGKFKQILMVDGYNVINAWENLKQLASENLSLARDNLNSTLVEYSQYKGYKCIVVYDAYNVKDSISRYENINNLEIIYTKENETADSYIEKYITGLPNKRFLDIFIATDDISVQQVSQGKGAIRISTTELLVNVNSANVKIREQIKRNYTGKNTLESFVDEDTLKLLDEIRKNDIK